jgi:membrane protease YdiL (CAAX protease family)
MTPLPNIELSLWLSFLPLALVGVLIQTGAEEVLFRGYMQQQLAARFSSPMMWMVLPSAIFAALHYQPEIMGDNTWLMMAAVFVFAVLAADLTAVTGNIGAAWAMHFVNNALAILVGFDRRTAVGTRALHRADLPRLRSISGRYSTSISRPPWRFGR